MRSKTIVVALLILAAVSLAGCANRYFQAAKAVETGIIEPQVDATVKEGIDRLCKLPPDIQVRQIGIRGSEYAEALMLMCPDYRYLAGVYIEVLGRRSGLASLLGAAGAAQ